MKEPRTVWLATRQAMAPSLQLAPWSDGLPWPSAVEPERLCDTANCVEPSHLVPGPVQRNPNPEGGR